MCICCDVSFRYFRFHFIDTTNTQNLFLEQWNADGNLTPLVFLALDEQLQNSLLTCFQYGRNCVLFIRLICFTKPYPSIFGQSNDLFEVRQKHFITPFLSYVHEIFSESCRNIFLNRRFDIRSLLFSSVKALKIMILEWMKRDYFSTVLFELFYVL